MKKVSVVVPIYNMESYLKRCLESLINQTMRDIEIIAINDGSTDSSLEILKEYKEKDSRIKIIDIENHGVSNSRNVGIGETNSDYIMFVDSDDWIDSNMIEEMYIKAEDYKADLIMCTYVREFSGGSKEKTINLPSIKIYKDNEVKEEILRKLVGPLEGELSKPEYLDALGTVWAKLYKSSIIKENKFKFVDLKEIASAEDVLFNINALNKVRKAVFINKPLYHYWKVNSKSLTSKYNPNLKNQRKNFFRYIEEFINENNLDYEFKKALNNRVCISMLGLGLTECCRNKSISEIQKIKSLKASLNEEYTQNAYKELELKYFPIHWRAFYLFNKYKMAIPSYCMLKIIDALRGVI